MQKTSRPDLSSVRIPVHTTLIVALDRKQQSDIHSKLNAGHAGDVLVWKVPHASDTTHWSYGFLSNIRNHINNGRFNNIDQLYIIGNPYHTSQARILSSVCPKARLFFIGPELKAPLPHDGNKRNIINAIRDMERRGHRCEVIDPATTTKHIIQKVLAKPAHGDELIAGDMSPQTVRSIPELMHHHGKVANFAGMSQL